MKSTFGCPACSQLLDWVEHASGNYRMFCGSVNCHDEICGSGSFVDTRMGQDNLDAFDQLKARFERAKEGVSK